MERGLRMRENSDGRSEVPPWRNAQRVYGAIDDCPGTIVSVDTERRTFAVDWKGNGFSVEYPDDTIMIRKAWPWEA